MKFIKEFKEFITRGNVMDMAIGIIIGAAFTAIVTSLTQDIISPFIGLFVNEDFATLSATIFDVEIKYGAFITSIINFLLVALVLFLIIKVLNGFHRKKEKTEEAAPPTCPYCQEEVNEQATRCPHCTSQLPS